ncbi:C1 family peptidase [Spirosoma sp. BT702]|uniref:C1 family peptidase n=1 Tax=Spirosoma profusum TaxID=2771354 RepID=A0A927ASS5_9BACT|nr:C1 family peptidase [Spirosoma profusum]MBD2701715.1 C1 family peptidase [Spirosoma profusum]
MNTTRILTATAVAALLLGCKKVEDQLPNPGDKPINTTGYSLGLFSQKEDLTDAPYAIKFGAVSADNLPASFDLTQYLPPVGNQGPYGTCAVWATGYYAKTAIEGVAKGYTAAQLSSPSYQISPRDLFTALDPKDKGADCNGTNFEPIMDVLMARGGATLAVSPYTDLGDCSKATASASWDTEAAKHKIKAYRLIDPTVTAVKQQLVNKVPVVIGAELADNFMTWNSDNVLSSNTTYDKVGMHAGHALTIIGYDDKKGPNGAFKVINSWGTTWGSKGFIWIDYNFMLNTFLIPLKDGGKELFVMSETAVKPNDDPQPQPNPTTKGVDLVAWVNSDASDYESTGSPSSRAVEFNIYNDGTADATPKTPWTAYYIYYNARNANDYGVLFQHTYSNKNLQSNKYSCANGNCELNISIPAYSSLSDVLFGTDDGVRATYKTPSNLSGSYYLVLMVDADDTFDEFDEEDNYFYTTDRPIKFKNGYAAREGYEQAGVAFSFKNKLTIKSPEKARKQFTTAVNADHQNAYAPQEIFNFIRQQKKSGALAQKVKQYVQSQATQSLQAVKSK